MPIESISDFCSALQKKCPAQQEGPFFSEEEKNSLSLPPKHIAIIPDGNRRWANKHNVPYVNGYIEGIQTIIRTTLAAKELKIPTLTAYSFSTENWKRPEEETSAVMRLFDIQLNYYADFLVSSNIRFHVIGDIARLPSFLQTTIQNVIQKTSNCSSLDLILAMNYGGRDEIVRAFKKLCLLHSKGELPLISEEIISKALDTHLWPDPDLVIRTSGEQRLSNFLLWQCNYAEVYTDQTLWPDFTPHHLLKSALTYQSRKRRFGGGEAAHVS